MTGGLKVFDLPYTLTNGGPGFATFTITQSIVTSGVGQGRYGLASALAVLFTVAVAALSIGQLVPLTTRGKERPVNTVRRAALAVVMIALALVVALPLYYILVNTFKTQAEMVASPHRPAQRGSTSATTPRCSATCRSCGASATRCTSPWSGCSSGAHRCDGGLRDDHAGHPVQPDLRARARARLRRAGAVDPHPGLPDARRRAARRHPQRARRHLRRRRDLLLLPHPGVHAHAAVRRDRGRDASTARACSRSSGASCSR